MSYLKVTHSNGLFGEVSIQGSKNSALPIIASTVLHKGQTIIKNCPRISDVFQMINILSILGVKSTFEGNTLIVNANEINNNEIIDNAVNKIRSSIIFAGALLGRCGSTKIAYPGGCKIGERKIDAHLDGFLQLGFEVSENDYINIQGRIDCDKIITLKVKSVGATENIIISSVLSDGKTVIINNAATEPEIVNLCMALNKMGADIKGFGSGRIEIKGVKELKEAEVQVFYDRIVAGTYIAALSAVGGNITLKNIDKNYDSAITMAFRSLGVKFKYYKNEIALRCDVKNKRIPELTISTAVYPGFPTDMQSQIMAVMSVRVESGIIIENIFENRFGNVEMLKKMGANIDVINNKIAVIKGVNGFIGCNVKALDLRSGAALCVAGLKAEGETIIEDAEYILRGYEHIDEDFINLSADVRFVG